MISLIVPFFENAWNKDPATPGSSFDVMDAVMFMMLFVILLVAWLLGFVAFHVAGGLIHILLLMAVISLILHLVRGQGARVQEC